LKSQSVDGSAACYRIGAIIRSLPRASLPLGSSLTVCIEMRWLGSGSVDSNKKSAGVQFVELLFLFRERCLLFHLA
jgi:hypothetical protein